VAGTGEAGYSGDGGPATEATLNGPSGLALDAEHTSLYIADFLNQAIRKVDLVTGIISTVVTLTGAFDHAEPVSLAVLGNLLFVVDLYNGTLSRLDLTEQQPTPTVVAGTGFDFAPGFTGDHVAATTTELSLPFGVTTDRTGKVYVVENRGQRIRRLGLVDISPGRFPNVVDLDSHRRLRVGILSTYGFDATQLDTSTLTVAGAPVTFTS
jgi:DNA-binding beta-propeller fold protein YncE